MLHNPFEKQLVAKSEAFLKVCTSKGIFRLLLMEELTFEPKPSAILGILIEKIHTYNKTIDQNYQHLYQLIK